MKGEPKPGQEKYDPYVIEALELLRGMPQDRQHDALVFLYGLASGYTAELHAPRTAAG